MSTGGTTPGGMAPSCLKAWTEEGDVSFKYGIPWGAVRKAGLHYGGVLKAIIKLTLGGITYNIGKQSKEGLVVVANNYKGVSFFLPDNKPMALDLSDDPSNIYDYLVMVAETEYGTVAAWDHFAQFIGDTIGALIGDVEPEVQAQLNSLPYTLNYVNSTDETTALNGSGNFAGVSSFSDFIRVLYSGLDEASVNSAKATPLSTYTMPDGSVGVTFSIIVTIPETEDSPAETQTMGYVMYIGVK